MKQLRSLTPAFVKRAWWQSRIQFRAKTGSWRVVPNFIIIGGQRCGTTSLYNYLDNHPNIRCSYSKEIHFFDLSYPKGQTWYKTHFPLWLQKQFIQTIQRQPFVTGEASPYYLFHPHVPKRVAALLPKVKLIVLLRNPIDRAYSHYHHEVAFGYEKTPSFMEAVEKEPERLKGEKEKLLADENYYSFNHHHYSYLARGLYLEQLKQWMKYFPAEQILILNSEQFYQHTAQVFERIIQFLELPAWKLTTYKSYNELSKPKIEPAMRAYLADYFAAPNQALYEYVQEPYQWQ